MSAPRTRRAALAAGAAAISALCAPALALAAPTVDLDAELLALIAQHPAAVEHWRATARAAHQVERVAIAARPERPAALEHRAGDFGGAGIGLADVEAVADDGATPRRWYGVKAVAWLVAGRPLRRWSEPAQAMVPDHAAEARRVEILAATQAHAAACLVVDQRVGLCAAEAAIEAAYSALSAVESRLTGLTPRTLAGLAAKAAWAVGSEDDLTMEAVLREVAAFGGVSA